MRALALVLALLFVPSAASAQDCPDPETTLDNQVFPRSTTGLAPTDTLIWYLSDNRLATHEGIQRALSVVSLGGDGDVEVEPAGAAIAGNRGLFAFRPVEPLAPDTDHEIQYPIHPLGTDLGVTTFRTLDGPAGDAPPVPVLESSILASDYSLLGDWCSSQDYRDEALFTLDSQGVFDLAGRAGGTWTFAEDPFVDPVAAIGAGRISLQEDIGPMERFDVRFGSLDLAGQFSGWSAAEATEMPASGCRDDGDSINWAMPVGLLLVGLGGLRRREAWLAVLVIGVALSTSAPTVAAAADGSESSPEVITDQAAEEPGDAATVRPPTWRDLVLERTARDLPVLVGIGVSAAVVDTVALASLAPRGHGALQTRLVNITVLAPTLSALVAIGGVRHSLLDRRAGKRITRGLRAASISLLSVAVPLSVFMQIGAVVLGQTDISLGIALMAVPASLWGTATTLIVYDDLIRSTRARHREGKAGTSGIIDPRRTRHPILLTAGPTGFTFVF